MIGSKLNMGKVHSMLCVTVMICASFADVIERPEGPVSISGIETPPTADVIGQVVGETEATSYLAEWPLLCKAVWWPLDEEHCN